VVQAALSYRIKPIRHFLGPVGSVVTLLQESLFYFILSCVQVHIYTFGKLFYFTETHTIYRWRNPNEQWCGSYSIFSSGYLNPLCSIKSTFV